VPNHGGGPTGTPSRSLQSRKAFLARLREARSLPGPPFSISHFSEVLGSIEAEILPLVKAMETPLTTPIPTS
jgi:hypothetical protein